MRRFLLIYFGRRRSAGLPKLKEIRYHWIREATGTVSDLDERVKKTEQVAFSRWDFAESTQKYAFERLKGGGRALQTRNGECGVRNDEDTKTERMED